MKVIVPLFVLLLVSACAHQPSKVKCDAHLTPINPPTAVVKTPAAPAAVRSAP